MCLSKVSDFVGPSEGIGWKWVRPNKDTWHGLYIGKALPYGQFIRCDDANLGLEQKTLHDCMIDVVEYKSGFHIFLSEEQAHKYLPSMFFPYEIQLVKVRFRKAIVYGNTNVLTIKFFGDIENEVNTVVAEEIFVEKPDASQ